MPAAKYNSTAAPVRPPAVAGTFYPADPKTLKQTLTQLLQKTTLTPLPQPPQILIVPHAGLTYSGRTAAAGFRQIEGKNYAKIILLGASHHYFFPHAAVYASGRWTTPLGQVLVHPELAQALLDKAQGIINDPSPHQPEHDLEVELIFLQKVLKDFQIVPILVSQPSEPLVEILAKKIAANFDAQTLLVVSTDLSHYPNWATANEVDNQTITALLSGQKKRLEETVAKLENGGYPNLDTAACGFQALRAALRVGELLKIKDWQEIRYENSGDTGSDKSRVVGYAAIVGYGERKSEKVASVRGVRRPLFSDHPAQAGRFPEKECSDTAAPSLPVVQPQPVLLLEPAAQKEALLLARRTLETYLTTGQILSYVPRHPDLQQSLGAFTTLRRHGQLRGCLGEFTTAKPLSQVIQRMVVAAAIQDPRFPPVTAAELFNLTIELSVMTPKKKINNWQNIKLGMHGVVVQKGNRAGTFLPQVANETGWNLEQFLGQLCAQKAGLPFDCYKDPTVNLYTFEAQVFGE